MIAALDATPLTLSSGGIRRYTEELAQALRTCFPEDEFHLISDQINKETLRPLDRKWWTIGVQRAMRRLGCEIFHGTDFAVPYLPLKPSVMTLHDLSPWRNREWHHGAERVRVRTPYLVKLGVATMLITPTEAVRREAIAHFRLDPSRVVAVPHAVSPKFRPVPVSIGKPYFVYVGTLEPRKNIPVLAKAWKEVRDRHDVDLVIAGRHRQDAPELPKEPGLRILGEVSDDDLPALYSGAIACVYPTKYEGFGLPVLEAMQCGAPVITSEDAAVMEVSGGAAIHATESQLASVMESLVTNAEERRHRRELSLRRAAGFSWDATARLTRDVYMEAIRRFHA